MSTETPRTSDRILDAALSAFGTRGYEATSLDALAADLSLTKQAVLYWYGSKEGLLDAVIRRGGQELAESLAAAVGRAGPGLDRIEAVMRAVFRFAVRRPELVGLLREVGRLGPTTVDGLAGHVQALIDRAVAFAEREMDAGTLRRSDPRLLLSFMYATVIGVATDAETRRVLGVGQSAAGLARLRRELFAFVRAAVAAPLPVPNPSLGDSP